MITERERIRRFMLQLLDEIPAMELRRMIKMVRECDNDNTFDANPDDICEVIANSFTSELLDISESLLVNQINDRIRPKPIVP